jgi:hypothetical protein
MILIPKLKKEMCFASKKEEGRTYVLEECGMFAE